MECCLLLKKMHLCQNNFGIFDQFTWRKKRVGSAQSDEVYFSQHTKSVIWFIYVDKTQAVSFIFLKSSSWLDSGQEYRAIYLFSSSSGFVVSPGPIIWLDYINWFHVHRANHNLGFLNCIQLYSFLFLHSTFFFY